MMFTNAMGILTFADFDPIQYSMPVNAVVVVTLDNDFFGANLFLEAVWFYVAPTIFSRFALSLNQLGFC